MKLESVSIRAGRLRAEFTNTADKLSVIESDKPAEFVAEVLAGLAPFQHEAARRKVFNAMAAYRDYLEKDLAAWQSILAAFESNDNKSLVKAVAKHTALQAKLHKSKKAS